MPVNGVSVEMVKPRLDALLERVGLTHTDLWKGIPMTESGYWRMLKNGSMDLRVLFAVASIMRVDPGEIVGETPPAQRSQMTMVSEPREPYKAQRISERPHIEDRLDRLEAELRKLKEQLRPR